jgi:hypothetical protein
MSEAFQPAKGDGVDEIGALRDRAGMLPPWSRPRDDIAAIRADPKSAVLPFCERLGYRESAVTVMHKWLDPETERAFPENADVH